MENFENIGSENIDWCLFEDWVRKTHHEHSDSVSSIMRYAKKYNFILFRPEKASILQSFSNAKRRLVMASLANLSKYLGFYNRWKHIVKNAGLRWGKTTKLEVITGILNFEAEGVRKWLLEAVQKLPKPHSTVLIFNALTGLRPSEGCLSCRLIVELASKGKLNLYLDSELMMLQHFKFKDLFLRNSKNAYLSFITKELLGLVLEAKPKITYNAMVKALRKRGIYNRLNNHIQ